MSQSARILDGKETAAAVRAEVAARVSALQAAGLRPGLAVVLVGEDPASQVYVRNKDRAAREVGIAARTIHLGADTRGGELLELVRELGQDPDTHGILVQLPLPRGLDAQEVLASLDPRKDVDGLHPANVAALVMGRPGLRPCTPAGCIEILDRHGIAIEGRHAVVVGRSLLVGKPLAHLLLERNATVTVAHSRTRDLAGVVGQGDIVVAAVGKAEMVRGEWLRPGAVVLDVGINRLASGGLAGDVHFESARERAGAITPVPGGIGPMTIAMLLWNTALAAARQGGLEGVLARVARAGATVEG